MTGLLIFIGLTLIILNVLSIKKQNNSFNGALGNAIENIDDYDIRLGELRREFSESILELQSEIMDMKEIMEKDNRLNKNYDLQQDKRDEKKYNFEKIEKKQPVNLYLEDVNNIKENEKIYDENKNEIIIEEQSTSTNNNNSAKVDEIKRLFSEGLSAEEISEILHLGKGEVLLIKDLYIR
jgi:hypothetical protein